MRRIVLAASLACVATVLASGADATVCRDLRGALEICAPHAAMKLCRDANGHIIKCRNVRPSTPPVLLKRR